jgi:hypothetical protein
MFFEKKALILPFFQSKCSKIGRLLAVDPKSLGIGLSLARVRNGIKIILFA